MFLKENGEHKFCPLCKSPFSGKEKGNLWKKYHNYLK
ncbi:MAG: hypothetical protein HFI77_12855 [Lachnospiraceae bacterium]|nr:hypothetical protein [Lachnospiraceae bacterium]